MLLGAAFQIVHHVLLLEASKSRRAELKSLFIHGVFLLIPLSGLIIPHISTDDNHTKFAWEKGNFFPFRSV